MIFFLLLGAAIFFSQIYKGKNIQGIASDSSTELNQAVYRYTDTGWESIDGSAVRIAVGPDGQPWVANSNGQLWHRVNNAWQLHDGQVNDLDVGANGSLWAVGKNGAVWRWTGEKWEGIDGNGTRIAVDTEGQPWVVNSSGQIWRRVNGAWKLISGAATEISIGGNEIWVLGKNHNPTSTPKPSKTPTPTPSNKQTGWIIHYDKALRVTDTIGTSSDFCTQQGVQINIDTGYKLGKIIGKCHFQTGGNQVTVYDSITRDL